MPEAPSATITATTRAIWASRSGRARRWRAAAYLDFNGSGRTDVQDIMQVAARWNNPAAYDPTYDIAPPFGSPIDIQDITTIAGQWDTACE